MNYLSFCKRIALALMFVALISPCCAYEESPVTCVIPVVQKKQFCLKDAVAGSQNIVIAKFVKAKSKPSSVSFYRPPLVEYECIELLKGSIPEKRILVSYDFRSDRNDPKPSGWKYSQAFLPKEGSKFILLMESQIENFYETSFGKLGRLEFTTENENRVKSLLKQKSAFTSSH